MRFRLSRPILFIIHGIPGAGKTYLASNLSNLLGVAHVDTDKIRSELFENPEFDDDENAVVSSMNLLLAEQLLKCGVSVAVDYSTNTVNDRRVLRDLARKYNAYPILVWLQIDEDTAKNRRINFDRSRSENSHMAPISDEQISGIINGIEKPALTEDYMVISGKHMFNSQKTAILKKLYDMQLISVSNKGANIKPESLQKNKITPVNQLKKQYI